MARIGVVRTGGDDDSRRQIFRPAEGVLDNLLGDEVPDVLFVPHDTGEPGLDGGDDPHPGHLLQLVVGDRHRVLDAVPVRFIRPTAQGPVQGKEGELVRLLSDGFHRDLPALGVTQGNEAGQVIGLPEESPP
jgi:hypothetical protein